MMRMLSYQLELFNDENVIISTCYDENVHSEPTLCSQPLVITISRSRLCIIVDPVFVCSVLFCVCKRVGVCVYVYCALLMLFDKV